MAMATANPMPSAPAAAAARSVRAIRGATSVPANAEDAILSTTRLMVETALSANALRREDLISIIFAVTPDLDAAFPARAARELGLADVPLLDMVSPAVQGSLPRTVRMLLTCETAAAREAIRHVYLGETRKLRPDLASPPANAPGASPDKEVEAK